VLHVGPLAFDPAESRRVRSPFLAENGWGDERAIEADLERRDELLAGAGHVVLWFEHDLFDQLQLLQVLAQVEPGTTVELVQADDYLGGMDADQLQALWPTRAAVDPARARDAWRGVTEGDLDQDVPALPHLAAALRRFSEEPERTKRQLLGPLAEGPRTALHLFVVNQEQEDAIFLGDAWAFLFLYELFQEGQLAPVGGGSMPLPPPRGDAATFASTMLEAR